jgi:outer membrane lipoprotein LolB
MSDRRALLAWLAALPLLATGCASTRPTIETPGVPPQALATTLWSGRFSVTLSESGFQPQEERASGRFLLEAVGDETRLELSSPLGQTLASATLTPARASLETAEGRFLEAESAEELTEQVLGWRLPIGNLPQWLRGRLEAPTEMQSGRPIAGREHGWAVRLENWQATGPTRLTLDWPADRGSAERHINLRLIVHEAS